MQKIIDKKEIEKVTGGYVVTKDEISNHKGAFVEKDKGVIGKRYVFQSAYLMCVGILLDSYKTGSRLSTKRTHKINVECGNSEFSAMGYEGEINISGDLFEMYEYI